jgi:hypothetical protein
MAVTVTNQTSPLGSKIVQDNSCGADAGSSAVAATDNATGAAGTLYLVEIDNSSYSTDIFFKLADTTNATAGTTAASMVLLCPASSKRSYVFPEGIVFDNGFSHWCTTGAAEGSTAVLATPATVRYVTT